MSLLRASWPLLALCALVSACALFFSALGHDVEHAVVGCLVYLVIVVGLYVFVGNSGIISFGHVAFVAIGAYVSALLTIPPATKAIVLPGLPGWIATLHTSTIAATGIAMVLAGAFALVAAIPLMRLAGIAASIATFALLVIVENVAQSWKAVTGGLGTLTGVPFDSSLALVLGSALLAMAIAFAYQRTAWGLRLHGSREDEVAASSLGVRVVRERRIAFVLSAMIVAGGGSLYAHYLGAFGPGNFYVDLTFLTLVMLIVGGRRSLAGAVAGTLVISLVTEVLGRWEANQTTAGVAIGLPNGSTEILVALVLIAILLRRSEGLLGGREIAWPRFRAPFAARVGNSQRPEYTED